MKHIKHAKIPATIVTVATIELKVLFTPKQREDWAEVMQSFNRGEDGPRNMMTRAQVRQAERLFSKIPDSPYESKLKRLVELLDQYNVDEVVFV